MTDVSDQGSVATATRDGEDFLVPVDYENPGDFRSYVDWPDGRRRPFCVLDTVGIDVFWPIVEATGTHIVRFRYKHLGVKSTVEAVRNRLTGQERFPDPTEVKAFFCAFPDEKQRDVVAFSGRARFDRVVCVHTSFGELQSRLYTEATWAETYNFLVVVET